MPFFSDITCRKDDSVQLLCTRRLLCHVHVRPQAELLVCVIWKGVPDGDTYVSQFTVSAAQITSLPPSQNKLLADITCVLPQLSYLHVVFMWEGFITAIFLSGHLELGPHRSTCQYKSIPRTQTYRIVPTRNTE